MTPPGLKECESACEVSFEKGTAFLCVILQGVKKIVFPSNVILDLVMLKQADITAPNKTSLSQALIRPVLSRTSH